MNIVRVLMIAVLLLACSKKSEPPKKSDPSKAPAAKLDDLRFEGKPVEQDADFPKERWVRTVLFDGKTPYLGFTYIDAQKGNCIKGEDITGLTDGQITKLFHDNADFPSSSMEPIPAGHPMTLLTPEEIEKYELPETPTWLEFYKH